MSGEEVNEGFSTTRKLTTTPLDSAANLTPMTTFCSTREGSFRDGGLRKRGLYKSNLQEPLITVITVTYNCGDCLEQTILSVLNQSYSNIEYIVIDGGSQDNTLEILSRYDHAIDYWVSEPDAGIYDAMNKGIRLSSGEWLNFLNAKDTFFESRTIEVVADRFFQSGARFIYSDVLLKRDGMAKYHRYKCDHQRLIINHQASVYQKVLHVEHGLYLVAPKFTISDYLFFSLVDQADYRKADDPIAIYDTTGASQSKRSVEQKFIVDYLLNGMPKYKFAIYFHLYYFYREAKAAITRLSARVFP